MQPSVDVEQLRQEHYNGTLISIKEIQPELWIVRIRPDEGMQPYEPGQYTTLGLGDWEPTNDPIHNENAGESLKGKLIRRAYSMSFPMVRENMDLVRPEELDYYEFYIALVNRKGEPGQEPSLTPRLFALKEGDRLFIGNKITGHYTLAPVEPGDQVVFAATGTGEAPHNCMIAHMLRSGYDSPIISIVCVRYAVDLAYKSLNERIAERYPQFRYITLTTREAWNKDRKVYIQDLVTSGDLESQTGITLDPANTHVYLCGNPSMIGVPNYKGGDKTYPETLGMVEILESRGFKADYRREKGNIHFEEYW